ncbi:MAG: DUF2490 domain-containing protein [Deltaproteobacteria bacterium]|nr:DUF2490 domain-containing protein [Deltaproteobacteria bacterium]
MRAAVVVALLAALPASALDHQVEHWSNVNVVGRIQAVGDPKPAPALYYLELQPRLLLSDPGPEELVVRAALGWEVAPHVIVMGGAAAIPAFESPIWTINETRLWQQVGYNQNLDRLNLALRGRLEERLFAARDASLRVRVLLRASYKLPILDDKLALLVWNELFVAFDGDNSAPYEAFDQSRTFAGVVYKFAPWFGVEAGYVNVVKGIPDEDSGLMRHVLSLNTFFNLL